MNALNIAAHYGVPVRTARAIKHAARRVGTADDIAFALVEQESDFEHIFGHDPGGLFPGKYVTRRRYRKLQASLRSGGGGANGVGLTQPTYPPYILDHDGLWRKRANVAFGLTVLKSLHREYGTWREALAVYNGGPSNPQWDYAAEVLARKRKWHERLTR